MKLNSEKIEETPIRSGVMIIAINNNKFLVLKRLEGTKEIWEFPKGGIKENETVEQCAKRELEEETGIKCISKIIITEIKSLFGFYDEKRTREYVIVLIYTKEDSVLLEPEFSEYAWLNYEETMKKLYWEDNKRPFEQAINKYIR
ncbi:MAG: NUDIX domain-containing protein [Nanoarchaeota archaeon]|nr:NUDIX domain-containing protein [Nanoarchaeota archaeon]